MSRINRHPDPVKLVLNFFYREPEFLERALDFYRKKYGNIEERMEPIPFRHTGYYEKEMGTGLLKTLVSFSDLVPRDGLPAIKLEADAMERELAGFSGIAPGRCVNIDPGMMFPEKFVLATGKNFPQRIYLGRGVYADLTLIYRHGRFESLPWTYTDYLEEPVLAFLARARTSLVERLRETRTADRVSERAGKDAS